jgi:hypothetical protein
MRQRTCSIVLAALVTTAAVGAGCGKKTPKPVVVNVGAAVSDAEARKFAKELNEKAQAGDVTAVSDMFDIEAMGETASQGLDIRTSSKEGFLRGMKSAAQAQEGFGGQLIAPVAGGGSLGLLRVLNRDGQKAARIRIQHGGEGGLNYMDVVLARRTDGKIRAVDVYTFATGELMSATIRRAVIQLAASENRGILARLTGAENDYIKNAPRIKEISQAIMQGRGAEALAICESLPDSLKNDKSVMVIRIRAASMVDEEKYMAAMEDFQKAYPNDPAQDLMSIDYFFLRKQYDKALEVVDRLDRAVGGDPYLDTIRAGALVMAGRTADAKKAAQRLAQAEPDKSDGPMTLLSIALAEKDHAETLRLLKLLESRFGMQFRDLRTVPEYAQFVRSPQHGEWERSH